MDRPWRQDACALRQVRESLLERSQARQGLVLASSLGLLIVRKQSHATASVIGGRTTPSVSHARQMAFESS